MSVVDPEPFELAGDALDEFIRQLFVCHWVLGEMIAGLLERAQSDQHDGDREPLSDDAYSMIRSAIGEVVDRHGPHGIEAATKLIDEVMDAISDDPRIFPPDPPVAAFSPDRHSRRRPVRRRRR